MSLARRACVLVLMAGLAPSLPAEDTQAPTTKPAPTPPAKTAEPPKVAGPGGKTQDGAKTAKAPQAATAKPAAEAEVDDELLEFLGSVDSDTGDQDWIDYLSETDIAKASKGSKGQRDE